MMHPLCTSHTRDILLTSFAHHTDLQEHRSNSPSNPGQKKKRSNSGNSEILILHHDINQTRFLLYINVGFPLYTSNYRPLLNHYCSSISITSQLSYHQYRPFEPTRGKKYANQSVAPASVNAAENSPGTAPSPLRQKRLKRMTLDHFFVRPVAATSALPKSVG